MRTTTRLALVIAAASLAGCGEKPAEPQIQPVTPPPPQASAAAPVVSDPGDFPLGQEWVKAMLEENEQKLGKMHEDLERIRRELDRLEASPERDSLGEVKQAMMESLATQEAEVGKLFEQAGEMRKVLNSETTPPGN